MDMMLKQKVALGAGAKANRLSQARLLIALDALLAEGSVSGAAESLGMQTSAMSRLLGELRDLYQDKILIRTGRGMRPTPFAESLRLRVRTLAVMTQELIAGTPNEPNRPAVAIDDAWSSATCLPAVPLSVTTTQTLDAAPSPYVLARRMATITDSSPARRRLAKYIATTAPGAGRSRPLGFDEAKDAIRIIIAGEADPIQIGALLMTMQYRGATAPELAGFIAGLRQSVDARAPAMVEPDLDWPVYLSPNWREAPWFIHAARLVADAGYKVLLHGQLGSGKGSGKIETAVTDAGISVCTSLDTVGTALGDQKIAYVPMGALLPQLQSLLGIYPLFETRTPVHSAVHLLNPLHAPAIILGAAQTSQHDLYRDVARVLEMEQVMIVGSSRDFAQINPGKAARLFRLVSGREVDMLVPADRNLPPSNNDVFTQREHWQGVWSGAARDERAEATIVKTAAAALVCLSRDSDASFDETVSRAAALWAGRRR